MHLRKYSSGGTWKPFLVSAIFLYEMLAFYLLFQGRGFFNFFYFFISRKIVLLFLITSTELSSFMENVNLLIFLSKIIFS